MGFFLLLWNLLTVGLINWIGIVLTLGLINYIVFIFSKQNKKRYIWSGIVLLLIAPIVFFVTMELVHHLYTIEFGTGFTIFTPYIYSILNTFLFLLNGIIIIMIGLFKKSAKKTYE